MSFLRVGIVFLLLGSLMTAAHAASSCNDIDISPTDITFQENKEDRTVSFAIENESNEDFELDDVRVQESSPFFELSVDEFPDQINGEDEETLRLKYDTVDVNGNKTDTFAIQLEGEFDQDNENCSFSDLTFVITVTIEDGEDACALIEVQADDVRIIERSNITHTFFITNNTSNDFVLQDVDVFDDGDSFRAVLEPSFSDTEFEKELNQNSTNQYSIDIESQGVSQDETDTAFIDVRGEFEDGTDCSFSDISGEFDVTVEDTGVDTRVCTEINVNVPIVTVHSGETTSSSFTLMNNASQDFFVDEYEITDKNYQVDFEEVSNPYQVELESTETFAFNAIGYPNTGSFDSNAFLTLKGHFSDGGSCLVNAKRVPYRFIGNENATCDSFYVGLKPITVVKGQEKLDVLFNNPLAYDATLLLYSDNGNVSPSKLIIPGDTVQMHTLYLSNTQKNQTLTIQTSIPGCVIPAQTSTLFFSGLENAPVQFVNPPSVLIIGTANEFALQVENNSAFTQEVELTMIAKPSGATFTKKLSIGGLDEPLIYLPTLNLHKDRKSVV